MEGSCYCGRSYIMKTSGIDLHPGRRYSICSNFEYISFNISPLPIFLEVVVFFFSWIDPPVYKRSRQIIHGLLRRVNKFENEVTKLEKEVGRRRSTKVKLWLGLAVSWLLIAWLLL
ncbi:hypothetical protein CDL12_06477 [Handroanthus impetiginosus]|uniref:Uncharacterized protein n=1 Tax=Handroanthus impetiginosus TaxID=429701 RepID=A0A2G9HTI8_9LAMI|nr:hypothetical protein CDL12_06477 [Handroanthus impetiginosus]